MPEQTAAVVLLAELIDEALDAVKEAWSEGAGDCHAEDNRVHWSWSDARKEVDQMQIRLKVIKTILGLE